MEQQLELVEVRPIQTELLSLEYVREWETMNVVNDESEKLCGERMNVLYERREKLKADRDSVVKPLQQAIKKVDEMANPILNPLKAAYDILNKKLGTYLVEKQKRQEAAKRKAQEEEAARIKAEAEKKAQEAIETGDDKKLEEAASEERVAAFIENAPVKAKQKTEVSSGASFIPVTRWYARVIDEKAIPREFLIVDLVRLNKFATTMKEKASVSGVQFYSETTNTRRS